VPIPPSQFKSPFPYGLIKTLHLLPLLGPIPRVLHRTYKKTLSLFPSFPSILFKKFLLPALNPAIALYTTPYTLLSSEDCFFEQQLRTYNKVVHHSGSWASFSASNLPTISNISRGRVVSKCCYLTEGLCSRYWTIAISTRNLRVTLLVLRFTEKWKAFFILSASEFGG